MKEKRLPSSSFNHHVAKREERGSGMRKKGRKKNDSEKISHHLNCLFFFCSVDEQLAVLSKTVEESLKSEI